MAETSGLLFFFFLPVPVKIVFNFCIMASQKEFLNI